MQSICRCGLPRCGGERAPVTAAALRCDIAVATLVVARFDTPAPCRFSMLQPSLDEADRMLDMGFLPIFAAFARVPRCQTLFRELVERDRSLTHQFQRSPKIVQIGRRANRKPLPNWWKVPHHLKMSLLFHLLQNPPQHGAGLFADNRRRQSGHEAGTTRNRPRSIPTVPKTSACAPSRISRTARSEFLSPQISQPGALTWTAFPT